MKKIILVLTTASILLTGCASENKKTMQGAGLGAVVGGALGAVIGHQSGNRDKGALAGALLGAAIGGYAGRRMDQQAKELEKIAETKRTEQGLVAKLKSDILFETGKAQLKPTAQKNLTEMATIMKKYPENILTINGFTDSTGSEKTNATLSAQRAEAVKSHLLAQGLPAATLTSQGLGSAQPVADNKTEKGRKQNRRVEIVVTVDESKVPAEKK